mmetsp:Transcript_9786/g.18746  ORF Transcript_9786/g.18746 Transcript_9786/m.18746 type:complete len:103 (+) Transcript_9786:102-410(+)
MTTTGTTLPGLLRWQVFTTYAVGFIAIWSIAVSSKPADGGPLVDVLMDWAPVWAILALGVYAAVSIFYGVANFRDCPEAATEIEQQVIEARKELKRRGIISS